MKDKVVIYVKIKLLIYYFKGKKDMITNWNCEMRQNKSK